MEQTIPQPFVAANRFGTDAPLRRAMREAYRADEAATVEALLPAATFDEATRRRIERQARDMVAHVRARRRDVGGLDAFMHEYDLSSQEGVALMCLAEALLRIPDDDTAEALIRDKIAAADWQRHLGDSDSLFVNASTWGLMLTGKVVRLEDRWKGDVSGFFGRVVANPSCARP